MLILSRRVGETLIIGDPGPHQSKVTILSLKGNQVRIGITAEKEVTILREEVHDRRQAQVELGLRPPSVEHMPDDRSA